MGVEEMGQVYSPCSVTYEGPKDEVSEPRSLSPVSSGQELWVGKEGQTLQPDLALLSQAVGKGAVGAEGNWAPFTYLLTLQTSYSPFLPTPSAKAFALNFTEIKAALSRQLPHLPTTISTACPASHLPPLPETEDLFSGLDQPFHLGSVPCPLLHIHSFHSTRSCP